MGLRHVLIAAILVAVSGCASSGAVQPLAPAPVVAGATSSGLEVYEFVRAFAGPTTLLEPVPTAVLLLSRSQAERNSSACGGYLAMPTRMEADAAGPWINTIVTRVPLKTVLLATERLGDCSYVLDKYDYDRAESLAKAIGVNSRPGPFLVVFFPGTDGSGGVPFVMADGSEVPVQELGKFVQDWKSSMAKAASRLPTYDESSGGEIDTKAAPSGICALAGKVAGIAMPVLIEVVGGALAEVPGVKTVVGILKRFGLAKPIAEAVNITADGAVGRVAESATEGCELLKGKLTRFRSGVDETSRIEGSEVATDQRWMAAG